MHTYLKLISLGLLASALTVVSACSNNESKQAAQPSIIKATVALPTMKCNTCARHITNAVKKVEGVSDVAVSVDEKNAVVTFTSDKADLPKIEAAIAQSGYDANTTKRDNAAYEKLDECCK